MVHINLLPPDIRKDIQKKLSASSSGIPSEIIIGSIGGVFFVIVFLHLVLMGLTLQRMAVYRSLEQKWKTMESQRIFIDNITKQLQDLRTEQTDIERLFAQTYREWAPTLNYFSSKLPKGIWFSKMSVEKGEWSIQGSAVARDMDEIVAINSYENKLRADATLKPRFQKFVLDSVQKRKVQKVNVADFTIKSALNTVVQERQQTKEAVKD